MPNEGQHAQDATNKNGAFPVESFLPRGSRLRVRRGQFIGRGGNTGNSTGPPIHIHVKPMTGATTAGEAVSIPFDGAWSQPFQASSPLDASAWSPLQGDPITGDSVLWPSPFLRRGEASGQAAGDTAITDAAGGVVTAFRRPDGKLRLTTWQLGADGAISENRTAEAGEATRISIAHPGLTRVVTACRDGSGNLKLTAWDISPSGSISRKGSASGGPVNRVAMTHATVGGVGVVTAVRAASGTLKVIAWSVAAGSDQLSRRGDAEGAPRQRRSQSPGSSTAGMPPRQQPRQTNLLASSQPRAAKKETLS